MNLGGGNAAASSSRTRTPFHRAVTAAIAVPPSAAGNFEYHLLDLGLGDISNHFQVDIRDVG
jgi:hypothetical protein